MPVGRITGDITNGILYRDSSSWSGFLSTDAARSMLEQLRVEILIS